MPAYRENEMNNSPSTAVGGLSSYGDLPSFDEVANRIYGTTDVSTLPSFEEVSKQAFSGRYYNPVTRNSPKDADGLVNSNDTWTAPFGRIANSLAKTFGDNNATSYSRDAMRYDIQARELYDRAEAEQDINARNQLIREANKLSDSADELMSKAQTALDWTEWLYQGEYAPNDSMGAQFLDNIGFSLKGLGTSLAGGWLGAMLMPHIGIPAALGSTIGAGLAGYFNIANEAETEGTQTFDTLMRKGYDFEEADRRANIVRDANAVGLLLTEPLQSMFLGGALKSKNPLRDYMLNIGGDVFEELWQDELGDYMTDTPRTWSDRARSGAGGAVNAAAMDAGARVVRGAKPMAQKAMSSAYRAVDNYRLPRAINRGDWGTVAAIEARRTQNPTATGIDINGNLTFEDSANIPVQTYEQAFPTEPQYAEDIPIPDYSQTPVYVPQYTQNGAEQDTAAVPVQETQPTMQEAPYSPEEKQMILADMQTRLAEGTMTREAYDAAYNELFGQEAQTTEQATPNNGVSGALEQIGAPSAQETPTAPNTGVSGALEQIGQPAEAAQTAPTAQQPEQTEQPKQNTALQKSNYEKYREWGEKDDIIRELNELIDGLDKDGYKVPYELLRQRSNRLRELKQGIAHPQQTTAETEQQTEAAQPTASQETMQEAAPAPETQSRREAESDAERGEQDLDLRIETAESGREVSEKLVKMDGLNIASLDEYLNGTKDGAKQSGRKYSREQSEAIRKKWKQILRGGNGGLPLDVFADTLYREGLIPDNYPQTAIDFLENGHFVTKKELNELYKERKALDAAREERNAQKKERLDRKRDQMSESLKDNYRHEPKRGMPDDLTANRNATDAEAEANFDDAMNFFSDMAKQDKQTEEATPTQQEVKEAVREEKPNERETAKWDGPEGQNSRIQSRSYAAQRMGYGTPRNVRDHWEAIGQIELTAADDKSKAAEMSRSLDEYTDTIRNDSGIDDDNKNNMLKHIEYTQQIISQELNKSEETAKAEAETSAETAEAEAETARENNPNDGDGTGIRETVDTGLNNYEGQVDVNFKKLIKGVPVPMRGDNGDTVMVTLGESGSPFDMMMRKDMYLGEKIDEIKPIPNNYPFSVLKNSDGVLSLVQAHNDVIIAQYDPRNNTLTFGLDLDKISKEERAQIREKLTEKLSEYAKHDVSEDAGKIFERIGEAERRAEKLTVHEGYTSTVNNLLLDARKAIRDSNADDALSSLNEAVAIINAVEEVQNIADRFISEAPELKGGSKQKRIAYNIRNEFIKNAVESGVYKPEHKNHEHYDDFINILNKKDSAKWWIENEDFLTDNIFGAPARLNINTEADTTARSADTDTNLNKKRKGGLSLDAFRRSAEKAEEDGTVKSVAARQESARAQAADDADTEARMQEAFKGVKDEAGWKKTWEAIKKAIGNFHSEFPELSRDKTLFRAMESLRRRNSQSNSAIAFAVDSLKKSLGMLKTPEQYQLFTRKRVFDDLAETLKRNENAALPFGLTPETLAKEREKIDALVSRDETVKKAVETELAEIKRINDELIAVADKAGLKGMRARLSRQQYFHHEVIAYAQAELAGDYMKARRGSSKDINLNYAQAMGTVRSLMLRDIEMLRSLAEIKADYDKSADFKKGDAVPKGYVEFKPFSGKLIFSLGTVADHISAEAAEQIERIYGNVGEEIVQVVSGQEDTWIIPQGIADALNRIGKANTPKELKRVAKMITSQWKNWTLNNPIHAPAYNLRNVTGDSAAAFAGNIRTFLYAPRAIGELRDVYFKGKKASGELAEFQKRGGAALGNNASLLYDPAGSKAFKNLDARTKGEKFKEKLKNPIASTIGAFMDGARFISDFREQILRYATYLSYLDQMKKSEDGKTPDNWGASKREEVLAVDDARDRAFKMSNELIGAYDQVSVSGQEIRDSCVPFYAWLEVNSKRFGRLLANNPANVAGKFGAAYAMMYLFNNFFHKDEEDELPEDVRWRPHINLGKWGGKVRYFDRIGMMTDLFEWVGLDDITSVKQVWNGQLSVEDFLKDMALAVPKKMVDAMGPGLKTAVELRTNTDTYTGGRINQIDDHIMNTFGLRKIYRAMMGKRGESITLTDSFFNMFSSSAEGNRVAYSHIKQKVREFQERVLKRGSGGFSGEGSPKSEAWRDMISAAEYGQKKKYNEARKRYIRAGGDLKSIKEAKKRLDPLSGLSKEDRVKFLRWLTPEERKLLDEKRGRAMKHYYKVTARIN